ncbi:MAG: hypothetical protein FGM46_03725 [Ferruginibacter sp.]|nr:hypothetical protein [Ferruginibacter sp.]
MDRKIEFIYSVISYELVPLVPPDASVSENRVFRVFIKKVYDEIVEHGNLALYTAVKFWLALDHILQRSASARILPPPMILEEFIDELKCEKLKKMLLTNRYSIFYNAKLFYRIDDE